VTLRHSGGGKAAASAGRTLAATAEVTRKDLAETQAVNGTLGYGTTDDVTFAGHGTVTRLAPVGAVVDRGGTLGEVDGQPVSLLFGDRPMWRDLAEGAADGPDIRQLEANLIALGYGAAGLLGPNDKWTQATTAAVKRWQHALRRPETGTVAMTDVVFRPAAVRVAAHAGNALKVTGTTRVVAIDLDAKFQALVKVGQHVQVELPDGTSHPGVITSVGTVATAQQSGSPTIAVVVTLPDQSAGKGLDQAPVTVHIVTTQASGVLAVPVGALLALSEGGYAVEKVTGPGTTTLVGVKLGAFADGWVQVTGNVNEHDRVVTAP
jgi:peptidoglycan hydrolase-like protein with peptidoglycan-binding domain